MAANMFVWIDDDKCKGDATEENHQSPHKWIPVKSVSWGVERAVDLSDLGSTQRGYANVNFGKIAVTSEMSVASAGLMLLAASGVARKMQVSQCRVHEDMETAMQRYLLWTLEFGQITKYELSCSEDGVPEESWEMAYRMISCEHTIVDAQNFAVTDTKSFGWNLETGKYTA